MSNISTYEFQKNNLGGNKQVKEKHIKILHVRFKMDETTTCLHLMCKFLLKCLAELNNDPQVQTREHGNCCRT